MTQHSTAAEVTTALPRDTDANERKQALLFWGIACFLLFWILGCRELWASEGRWAEITREMFLNQNFFHPTINGQAYFDKPLLTYWLVAIASFLPPGGLNEWAVRLPSALAALLTLWATRRLGCRLWSKKVGHTAGWLLLSTYGLLFWGRTGAADMENLATVMLATLWFFSRRNKLNFKTFLVFYLICFVGAHTKGLPAVVIPVLVLVPDMIRENRWKSLLKWPHLLALAAGLAVYSLPFLYADLTKGNYGESGLLLMIRENVIRFFKPFDHKGPIYLYFYYLPILLVPWSPLIVTAIIWLARSYRKLDRPTRWLGEAAALIFLFFSASGSRRGYYILPILPFCALIGAIFLHHAHAEKWQRIADKIQNAVILLPAALAILVAAAFPLFSKRSPFIPPPGLRLTTFLLGTAALVIWLLLRGKRFNQLPKKLYLPARLTPLLFPGLLLIGGYFCCQQPYLDSYRTERGFSHQLKQKTNGIPPTQIAFFRSPPASILFYLAPTGPVTTVWTAADVKKFLTPHTGSKVLVIKSEYIPTISAKIKQQPSIEFQEKSFPWSQKEKIYHAWIFR